METGTIQAVTSNTTGSVQRDVNNQILNYDEPSITFTPTVGMQVSFDVVEVGRGTFVAQNLQQVQTGPVNTTVEIDGDYDLSDEAKATLDELVMDIDGSTGKYKLKIELEKEGEIHKVKAKIKKGTLSNNAKTLWLTLLGQLMTQLFSLTTDGELEIKIKKKTN